MLSGNLTLGEYLEQWLNFYCTGRLAANTVRGYSVNIHNHIIPIIGSRGLHDLTPQDIDELYYLLRSRGLSSTTIIYVHAVLRKALNTAKKRRLLAENIIDYVDPPKRERYKASFIDGPDMQKLLDQCKSTDIYIPVLLALSFGLRRGEVLGLRWSDIDFNKGTIAINQTATYVNGRAEFGKPKTDTSRRALLMPSSLSLTLMEWKARQGISPYMGLVCTDSDGNWITPCRFQKLFKRCLKAAALPDVRIHDLRHSYATLMLENNVSPKIVCEILGHSSVDVTLDIYSHVLTKMQRPAADVIDGLFQSSQLDETKNA